MTICACKNTLKLMNPLLFSFLPAPTQPIWDRDEERQKLNAQEHGGNGHTSDSRALVSAQRTAPPYGKRKGWIPRTVDDFGDGGWIT